MTDESPPDTPAEVTCEMWAIVFPHGRIITGSACTSEEEAWQIALGWPCKPEEDIPRFKARGAFAVKARLTYTPPPIS